MGNGTDESEAVAEGSEELIKSSTECSEDWVIECSDDESYNPNGQKGNVWEPKPEDIKELYERLSRGEILDLQWVCPGRRSPSPEVLDDDTSDLKDEPEEEKEEERILPKGFDFDEDMDSGGIKPGSGFTPRRTPGSAQTPRSQKKRVARMDKIMSDILRHKQIEAAERKNTPGRRMHGTPTGQRKPGAFAASQRRLLTQTGGDKKTERPNPVETRPPPPPPPEDKSTVSLPGTIKQETVQLPKEISPLDQAIPNTPTECVTKPTDPSEKDPAAAAPLGVTEALQKPAEPVNMPSQVHIDDVLSKTAENVTARMHSLTCEPTVPKLEPVQPEPAVATQIAPATTDATPAPTTAIIDAPSTVKMEEGVSGESEPSVGPAIPSVCSKTGENETTDTNISATKMEIKIEPTGEKEGAEPMETSETPSQPPASETPSTSGEKMET